MYQVHPGPLHVAPSATTTPISLSVSGFRGHFTYMWILILIYTTIVLQLYHHLTSFPCLRSISATYGHLFQASCGDYQNCPDSPACLPTLCPPCRAPPPTAPWPQFDRSCHSLLISKCSAVRCGAVQCSAMLPHTHHRTKIYKPLGGCKTLPN